MNTTAEKTTPPAKPVWVAGFMSGTSLDAVDAAVILTDGERVEDFGPAVELRYSAEQRAVLQAATEAARAWNWTGPIPETPFKAALGVITRTHAEAWHMLTGLQRAPQPLLVGVHGQTVLHRRAQPGQKGATLQLVDPFDLRRACGVPLVCDFRSADVEAGGQGAPLAPAYHGALLDRLGREPACVLNLGGVANITARLGNGSLIAFDTGPANGPIDEWVEGHGKGTHDAGGRLALAGTVQTGLLAQWMNHAWFSEKPPKSLDRYDFSAALAKGLSLEDGAATLTAFSAAAVAAGVDQLPETPTRVIACGGGRHNPALMAALKGALRCPLITAEDAGWRGDSIEAEAFAYLAARRMRELPLSWPMTTGVPAPMTGGQVFL